MANACVIRATRMLRLMDYDTWSIQCLSHGDGLVLTVNWTDKTIIMGPSTQDYLVDMREDGSWEVHTV